MTEFEMLKLRVDNLEKQMIALGKRNYSEKIDQQKNNINDVNIRTDQNTDSINNNSEEINILDDTVENILCETIPELMSQLSPDQE